MQAWLTISHSEQPSQISAISMCSKISDSVGLVANLHFEKALKNEGAKTEQIHHSRDILHIYKRSKSVFLLKSMG